MEKLYQTYYDSPIGILKISANNNKITSLEFVEKKDRAESGNKVLQKCTKQLDEYFAGKRKDFELDLELNGTDFQKQVWKQLLKIPYAKTKSYGDIAEAIQNPKSVRAVGMANKVNRIAIIVPCHRVIGSDGSLTGYATGVWRKEWLLKHEKDNV